MIVIVDSNEQATNPRIVEHLRTHFKNITVSKLTSGDVNIITDEGKVISIERKEAHDLLGSIGDGRVFHQVENMANNSDYSAIIVTGNIDYDKNDMVTVDGEATNWRGKSVRGAITAIMWSACPVLKADVDDYAITIMEVIEFCNKPGERKHLKPRPVTFPPVDERVEILACFPGVGLKRAEALLRFVGSNGEYGPLGNALMWAANMIDMEEDCRPTGWGRVTIDNYRGIMGLASDEKLIISKGETNGS